ncbi:MAG TPA: quinol:electron acceptor oxidoreductase subunit ActD [Anaerolineales bacterium]
MADSKMLLAVFEDIEPAASGIEKLHELGVGDADMNVISGIPIRATILDRPSAVTRVATIGLAGAILGFLFGVFLVWGTPYLFPLHVGGQPVYPFPQLFIIVFEMTMLGLMGFSFLGLFVDSGFPSYTPKEYIPQISDGRIGVLFRCPADDESKFVEALTKAGAESVSPAEARQL